MTVLFARIGLLAGALVVALSAAGAAVTEAVPVHPLTFAERKATPNTAILTIDGRPVAFRVLRAAHAARVARFAQARESGLAMRSALATQTMSMSKVARSTVSGSSVFKADVAAMSSTIVRKAVPQNPATMANAPRDARNFCKAAAATVCLYVPMAGYMNRVGDVFTEADYLISEPVCVADGGTWQPGNYGFCGFAYPAADSISFDPGNDVTFNYKFSDSCKPNFGFGVDPHGAMLARANFSVTAGLGFLPMGGVTQSCVGYAYL